MIDQEQRGRISHLLSEQGFFHDGDSKAQIVEIILDNFSIVVPGADLGVCAMATARLVNAMLLEPGFEDTLEGLPKNVNTLLKNSYSSVLNAAKEYGGVRMALANKEIWNTLTLEKAG